MVFIHKSNLPNLLKVSYRKKDLSAWKNFFKLSGLDFLCKKIGAKKIELVKVIFSLIPLLAIILNDENFLSNVPAPIMLSVIILESLNIVIGKLTDIELLETNNFALFLAKFISNTFATNLFAISFIGVLQAGFSENTFTILLAIQSQLYISKWREYHEKTFNFELDPEIAYTKYLMISSIAFLAIFSTDPSTPIFQNISLVEICYYLISIFSVLSISKHLLYMSSSWSSEKNNQLVPLMQLSTSLFYWKNSIFNQNCGAIIVVLHAVVLCITLLKLQISNATKTQFVWIQGEVMIEFLFIIQSVNFSLVPDYVCFVILSIVMSFRYIIYIASLLSQVTKYLALVH